MESLVTVATFDFRTDAEVAKLLLEQNGIQAFLGDDNLVGLNWLLSNALGGVKLQVAAAEAERAGEILQRAQPATEEAERDLPEECVTFACQECGKRIAFRGGRRGRVEECPECGSFVDVPDRRETAFLDGADGARELMGAGVGERTNGQLWAEVLAILCLAYLPWMFGALSAIAAPTTHCSFIKEMLGRMVDAIQVSLPTLAIIWLSRDRWSLFGIVRPKWCLDAGVACVIWMVCVMFSLTAVAMLPLSMLEGSDSVHVVHRLHPGGALRYGLLLTTFLMGAFAEELVFRAYLIVRFERLLGSTWAAVLVTTAMFASYHVYYQRVASVVSVAGVGLACAVSFCLLRRLWPVWLAHALYNAMLL
jgi:membrane protease YdiL (CAAX protease family)